MLKHSWCYFFLYIFGTIEPSYSAKNCENFGVIDISTTFYFILEQNSYFYKSRVAH